MPIYEYQCARCGKITEVRHGVNDPRPEKCPQFQKGASGGSFYMCNGKLTRLVSKIGGFVLKGPGFFRNDYPRNK